MAVVAVVAFTAVLVRVGQLQTSEASFYSAAGVAQRMTVEKLPADRGAIVDRNGRRLAESLQQQALFADPSLVPDKPSAARLLAPVLGTTEAQLLTSLNKSGRFVYLKHQVTDRLAGTIRQMKQDPAARPALTGIELLPEPSRFYPAESVAAAVLGGVSWDGKPTGGLEKQAEELLRGDEGELQREVDRDGRTIPSGNSKLVPPTPGQQVMTTLDRNLQYAIEQETIAQVREVNAKGGYALVEDVTTGDILAMVNVRRDPKTGEVSTTSANLAVTDPFEPGSVNKVIAFAAALEAGLIEPNTPINVPRELVWEQGTKWEKRFHDTHEHGNVQMTAQQVLAQSSNIGTILVANKVGKEGLDAAFRNFGLGQRTGIGFPGESRGLYLPLKNWSGTSLPTMAIGQGVAVTALQMLSVYATIGNGGEYRTPRLLKATVDADGKRHELPVAEGRRVVSEETAQQLNLMLRDVITDAGTGKKAGIPGYTVAGKTGTAQKPQGNGSYVDDQGVTHYISSFVGLVPADAPKLAIAVVIDDPTGNLYYASDVAAPLFQSVGQLSLTHLRIPPTLPAAPSPDAVANTLPSATSVPTPAR